MCPHEESAVRQENQRTQNKPGKINDLGTSSGQRVPGTKRSIEIRVGTSHAGNTRGVQWHGRKHTKGKKESGKADQGHRTRK